MSSAISSTQRSVSCDRAEIPPLEQPSKKFLEKCELISTFMVPSRERTRQATPDFFECLTKLRDALLKQNPKSYEFSMHVQDGTAEGALVNGLHFPGTLDSAILFLHGNGGFYEMDAETPLSYIHRIQQTTANGDYPHLIVSNPAGAGKSKGMTHPDNTAREVLAQCEYLVNERGVDPNKIVVIGYSMGGFLGAFGAALVQKRFPGCMINFLSERSFSDILTRSDIRTVEDDGTQNEESQKTWHTLLRETNWTQNPLAALERLRGRVAIVYNSADKKVEYDCSQHDALLRAQRRRSYSCLALDPTDTPQRAHTRPLSDEELKIVVAELKRMLDIPLSVEEEWLPMEVLDPNAT